MATTYNNVLLKRFNGTDWDVLNLDISSVTNLQSTLNGKALTNHSHGNITSDGRVTSTPTYASGDYLLISDTSESGAVTRGIGLGYSTTTFLRNDGTWGVPSGPTQAITSVNGYTGVVNTVDNIITSQSVNSVTYGRTYGIMQKASGAFQVRLRMATGFYAPSGSSSGNSISFGTTFSYPPMVMAFCLKAGSTTNTVISAKITSVSTTGATVISSYTNATSSGFTPSAETYGWIAIGY